LGPALSSTASLANFRMIHKIASLTRPAGAPVEAGKRRRTRRRDMGGAAGATAGGTPALDAARRMSHGEQLARTARKYPDRVAFVCGEDSRTFREGGSRVNRLARGLGARGVGQGDRLAVLMGNSIEMVEAIFAGWRLGAIVVPVNFRLVAGEVEYVLDDSGAL